jgi:uncharacterized delta-60 repeat protein
MEKPIMTTESFPPQHQRVSARHLKLDLAVLSYVVLCSSAYNAASQSGGFIQFPKASYHVPEIAGIAATTVQRTGDTNGVVSVDFQTTDGTAEAGRDFEAQSGTLTFLAGEAQKTIVVPVLGNGFLAGDRSFTVCLSRPTGGALLGTNAVAAVTLLDNARPDFVDTNFRPAIGNVAIGSITMQQDGKLLLLGLRMLRLSPDGSLDPTFNLDPRIIDVSAGDALVQPDGKIVLNVGGVLFENLTESGMVRLNSDGSLDKTFPPGRGADGIYSFLLQPDGKVVVGGLEIYVDGSWQTGIARLNADGSWDKSFHSVLGVSNDGTSTSGPVQAMALQSDGKIVLGGYYLQVNGAPHPISILRLNPDGSLDDQYNPVVGKECFQFGVSTLAIQPDDKVIIYGCFASVNGVPRDCVARLNVDGSTDRAFEISRDFGSISRFSPRADGKIFCTGGPAGIFRLQQDGSLDESFLPGAVVSGSINDALELPNGRVLVGGAFTSVNGVDSTGLVRLFSESNEFIAISRGTTNGSSFSLTLISEPDKRYIFEASTDLINWSPFRTNDADSLTLEVVDHEAANLPRRLYRARDATVSLRIP